MMLSSTSVTTNKIEASPSPSSDFGDLPDNHFDEQFRSQAVNVLGRFRQAMERMVYSLTKSLETSRSFQTVAGVDRNISWQIFKLLGPIETLSTVSYIPPLVTLRKLLAATRKRGASADSIEEVESAFAAFEALVANTTGDLEQFETAVMSYIDSPDSTLAGMHHRKAAFKAHYHFLGVSVDVVAHALLFHPSQTSDQVDFVGLRQMLGMRRLRASTNLVVDRWRINCNNPDQQPLLSDALDSAAAAQHNAAVLPEFCTQPLLPLVTKLENSGDVRTLLKHRDIAVGREVDITTGRVFRNARFLTAEKGAAFNGLTEIGRPTRVHVVDTFVHRSTWSNLVPHSGVFAHLLTRDAAKVEGEAVRLPFSEKLAYMGSGADVLRISESPRYPELVKYACQKMGWKFEEFDLYRIRLDYPLVDSNILCRLESIAAQ